MCICKGNKMSLNWAWMLLCVFFSSKIGMNGPKELALSLAIFLHFLIHPNSHFWAWENPPSFHSSSLYTLIASNAYTFEYKFVYTMYCLYWNSRNELHITNIMYRKAGIGIIQRYIYCIGTILTETGSGPGTDKSVSTCQSMGWYYQMKYSEIWLW